MRRRQWRTRLTRSEAIRGWVFFALYFLLFPFLMSWVQRSFGGEWPVAEANVVYYLLSVILLFLLLWSFLKKSFGLLLDWLPENIFSFTTALAGYVVLSLPFRWLSLPVSNPNTVGYAEEYFFSPQATIIIVVLLMPIVEEILFRGLLFECVRFYSRPLAYILSTVLFCLFCVWQFVFNYSAVDLRYLLLMVEYLPMALALCWCYDIGGSIWSAVGLHMVINGMTLFSLVHR